MNPIRAGRAILFLLPYVLVVVGILAAGKTANTPEGFRDGLQALAIAAIGAVWAYLRARRTWRDGVDDTPSQTTASQE